MCYQQRAFYSHCTPILLATACFGSNTLDELAMTSNALKTARRLSTASRRESLSLPLPLRDGITMGAGAERLVRSFSLSLFLARGRSCVARAGLGFSEARVVLTCCAV